ncbi:hypothetical protein SEA_ZANELLA_55 [Microbacterium phage Zanella]|nr:hypothetical protein SEA_ZANELLA_55 [Microbacterium phage Zanella]
MNEATIKVGQVWEDLDARNAKRNKKGEPTKFRRVEIVALPTLSRKGVMRVISAPLNRESEGKLREFTRGKLLNHYGLVK